MADTLKPEAPDGNPPERSSEQPPKLTDRDRSDLRLRLIGIRTPALDDEGYNVFCALASYFEDRMEDDGDQTDAGWLVAASDAADEVLDAIHEHYMAALENKAAQKPPRETPHDGSSALKGELERLRAAASAAYHACMSAWACGEPAHRVKNMIDAVGQLGAMLGYPSHTSRPALPADGGRIDRTKGSYVPGPGVPTRSPQLLRDLKPERPGVPETIEQVPLRIAIPLLVGKAHSELHEIVEEPRCAEEYADLQEVLRALADACGHGWDQVQAAAASLPSSIPNDSGDIPQPTLLAMHAGRLHGRIEAVALDLGRLSAHAEALECLWSLASLSGVDWSEVVTEAESKRERLGGFIGHRLWSSHP